MNKGEHGIRILITGASGMLGATLVNQLSSEYDVYATSRENFKNNQALNFMEFDLSENSYDKLLLWS